MHETLHFIANGFMSPKANINYSVIFLYQEIKMEEAMIYTGIHTFLFFAGSFFPNNCMIQPFRLISVSYRVAQSLAGVHACSNSARHRLVSWLPICHFASKSAHCHNEMSQGISSPPCLFAC